MKLTGPHSKIERANRHIAELEAVLSDFVASNDQRFVIEEDSATGHTKTSFESCDEVLEEVSLIVGDTVHNLRVALDHIMYQVVISLDPSANPDKIKFPISNNENGVKTALDKPEIKTAMATPLGAKIAKVILNEIKPYGTFSNDICAVSKLDNVDKHRLVIATLGRVAATFSGRDAFGNTYTNCGTFGKLGAKMEVFQTNIPMQTNLKSVTEIFIGETRFPRDQPIVPTLKKFSEVVAKALAAIERCINTHEAPSP